MSAPPHPEPRVAGTLAIHPRGFGFFEPDGGEADASCYVAPVDLAPFLADDRVEAEIAMDARGRRSAKDLRLLERTRATLFGEVAERDGRPILIVDRQIASGDWPLEPEGGKKGKLPKPGALVVATIRGDKAQVTRVVSPADASLERVVARHALRVPYPAAVEREVQAARAPSLAGRRDLTAIPTVTIDAPYSRDLDDALAVLPAGPDGALRLLVSIADVDSMVPVGSATDLEARQRGTSVYLAGQVIPMIPPALSEDRLSLLAGQVRPALTVELRIDPEGQVTSVDLYESSIRSTARLSYEAVARAIDEGREDDVDPSVRETVRWLRTAAARVAVVRGARGGVELWREEAHITLDEQTREPIGLGTRQITSAHTLVERLMVAANEAVASWLVERGLPGVFRVHDEPLEDRVAALDEAATRLGIAAGLGPHLKPRALAALEHQFKAGPHAAAMYAVLARALGPARYTVHPSPHFGLAAPLYLHFTSPIRRYADLAVHRIVKGYLRGERDRFAGESALEELSRHLNDAARRSTRAETERLWMLAARLFSTRIGERMQGTVVDVRPFGAIVQLDAGARGTLAPDTDQPALAVGHRVDIEIAGVDEELGRIELRLPRSARRDQHPARTPSRDDRAARPPSAVPAKEGAAATSSARDKTTRGGARRRPRPAR